MRKYLLFGNVLPFSHLLVILQPIPMLHPSSPGAHPWLLSANSRGHLPVLSETVNRDDQSLRPCSIPHKWLVVGFLDGFYSSIFSFFWFGNRLSGVIYITIALLS